MIMEDYIENKKYQRAKDRVEEIKGVYYHLISFIAVIATLAIINYVEDKLENPWFLWVAFSWGIGLIIHILYIVNWAPFMKKEWEERKIREFMQEERESEHRYK